MPRRVTMESMEVGERERMWETVRKWKGRTENESDGKTTDNVRIVKQRQLTEYY